MPGIDKISDVRKNFGLMSRLNRFQCVSIHEMLYLTCMTTSDWIAIIAMIIALITALVGLYIAFYASRIQLMTFLTTLLAGKAREANDYVDLAEKSTGDTLHYQNALAAIVQATEMYEELREQHCFLLPKASRVKFMHLFYLQWRTGFQNKIFADENFVMMLTENKQPDDKVVIRKHLARIKKYLRRSHKKFLREKN